MIEEIIPFSITLNGEKQETVELPAHWRLIDYLHEIKGLTGTKLGCGAGYCKACTVCVRDGDGRVSAAPSCSTSLRVCNGWNIETIESLGTAEKLHPLQAAAVEDDAFQCGYCTPGFLMEAYTLYENLEHLNLSRDASKQMLADTMESHLCRCTGYQRYVGAFERVIVERASDTGDGPMVEAAPRGDRLIADPRWQLVRLLHEAAEVETTLMIQYLYATFSLKTPLYSSLAGFGHRSPGKPLDFLAVAIEEMSHLDTVNRLLTALGSTPNLTRQDLPWEPVLYPFPFSLEPLGIRPLCKYIYVEAARGRIENDPEVKAVVDANLPGHANLNQVGSIYKRIRTVLREAQQAYPQLLDWDDWDKRLEVVQDEGEEDHYEFFRSVLLGYHPSFHGVDDPWALPIDHPMHPVIHYQVNPTAFPGMPDTIPHDIPRQLAMLANRHYWLTMGLLESSYRHEGAFHPAARRHMAGPLLQLCRHLPKTYGVPVPFDKSPLEFHAGIDASSQFHWMLALLEDIRQDEVRLAAHLPAAYLEATGETSVEVETTLRMLAGKTTDTQ